MEMSLDNVKDVYEQQLGADGPVPQLIGRYMADPNGNVEILADYHGYLHGIEGEDPKKFMATLNASPYFRVVSRQEMLEGKHTDLLPESEIPEGSLRPASVFDYHHPMLEDPMKLDFQGGHMRLNGHILSHEESERIMDNIRTKQAKIRYNQTARSIQKMETVFEDLMKIEPHLADALGQLRAGVTAGHIHPDVLRHLSREIFTDPMVQGVGNKKAYADFLARPKEGVHIQLDGNDFGQINKIHSFEHGNQAITAMGTAIKEARDETVGTKHGKVFRIGGDEFTVHVPTHEHAAHFMRNLRQKLEAIPPVGGTHQLSVSAGIGTSPQQADQAQIQAKVAKKAAGYKPGMAKTHVYSAVPGHEGHIPMDPGQLPISPPPASVAEKPAGGPATPPVAPAAPAAAPQLRP
jgi:GGDEF domain-containing protein